MIPKRRKNKLNQTTINNLKEPGLVFHLPWCINKNQYFAIIIIQLMLTASIEVARYIAKYSFVVKIKSYSEFDFEWDI